MRILVTGSDGMLGSALVAIGASGYPRRFLDVTDTATSAAVLEREQPDAVLFCAAQATVDACGPQTEAVNVQAPAWWARRVPTWLVSTNYVFDGPGPHAPGDPRRPCNPYGEQKARAEDAVLQAGGHVVRTGWLFAPGGRNFPSRLPELLTAGPVTALEGWPVQPTFAPDLARHLMSLPQGVSHAIGSGETTWADFARELARRMGLPPSRVRGVRRLEGVGPRPSDARLSPAELPSWQDRLEELLP